MPSVMAELQIEDLSDRQRAALEACEGKVFVYDLNGEHLWMDVHRDIVSGGFIIGIGGPGQ